MQSAPGRPDVAKVRATFDATTDLGVRTMPPARRAFLDGLIDYAGLFPPAELALEPALDLYGRYRTGPDAWMLGRFLIPAARLADAEPLIAGVEGDAPVRFSVLGAARPAPAAPAPAGVPPDPALAWLSDAEAVIAVARGFERRLHSRAVCDAFEFRLPVALALDPDALAGVLGALAPRLGDEGRAAVEIPFLADAGTPEPAAYAIDEANGRLGRDAFAAKLRCGGEGVPSPGALASALTAARRAGVPTKATAGLHHPLRHATASGPDAPGFVNVFGGAILAAVHDLAADDLAEILDSRDPAEWTLGDTLGWRSLSARPEQVETARARTALGYGSCSFDEPREDLRALDWL